MKIRFLAGRQNDAVLEEYEGASFPIPPLGERVTLRTHANRPQLRVKDLRWYTEDEGLRVDIELDI